MQQLYNLTRSWDDDYIDDNIRHELARECAETPAIRFLDIMKTTTKHKNSLFEG